MPSESVIEWLTGIGLVQYAPLFAANEIDADVLPELTEQDLEKLSIPLGHRKKLLKACAALRADGGVSDQDRLVEDPKDQAERRQLTVVFCDLVGSTQLAHRLDPENYRELVREYQNVCSDVVRRFDGHIAQYLGDGVLAYFGYPKAHEDDAQRAVSASLGMVEAVARLEPIAGPLSVRIGIHTGLVVVGDVGSGTAQESLALGDTPNVAARLQAIAQPGTVVLSDHTRQLAAGSFEYRDLESHALKGIADPVRVWQALRPSHARSRFEATHGTLAPMVGRELESAVLMHAWRRSKSGKGQLILLCGEPGIGKSRLLRGMREMLAGQNSSLWQYQCSPFFVGSALYPVIDNLERALKFERDEPAGARLDRLERLLEGFGRPEVDLSLIARLLSLPAEERYGRISMTPQRQKTETIRALNDIIAAAAKQQPLLLLFEDLHWADPTTLESLDALVRQLDHLAVLIVATHRPEFRPPWVGEAAVTALTLSRLDSGETEAIVARVAGGKSLPEAILKEIVAKTDGIPLFVEELTKTILESNLLAESDHGYTLAAPLPPLAIPSTLRDSLMARLDRLAPIKQIAQIGACIGREFSEELLSFLVSLSEEKLHEALDQLIASELIQRRGQPPHTLYVFKHALVQEAAYDSLLKVSRVQFHAQIAQVLVQHFPALAEAEPEVLAHHYAESGNLESAASNWLRAGQNNVRRSANDQAIPYFERALAALSQCQVSETIERLELELQLAYLPALMAAVGFADQRTLTAANRALALSEKFETNANVLFALFAQFSYRMASASFIAGAAIALQMVELGERTGDSVARVVGYRAVGFCNLWMGNLPIAEKGLESALRLASTVDHHSLAFVLGHDPIITAQAFYGVLRFKRGYPDQANKLLAAAVEQAQQSGHGLTLAYVLYQRVFLDLLAGDYAALRQSVAAFQESNERHQIKQWYALGAFASGLALRYSDTAIASSELERLLGEHLRGTLRVHFPTHMMLLSDAYAHQGDVAKAKHWLSEALAGCERTAENWPLPEIYFRYGQLYGQEDNEQDCERWLVASLHAAVNQEAKLSELRAATALARRHTGQGRRSQARELLQPVYDWFTEGFGTRDLKDAKALLEQLRP